jgi:hypothetical protein
LGGSTESRSRPLLLMLRLVSCLQIHQLKQSHVQNKQALLQVQLMLSFCNEPSNAIWQAG